VPGYFYFMVMLHLMQMLSDFIKDVVGDQYELRNAAGAIVKSGRFEVVSAATGSSLEKAVYVVCTMRDTSEDEYTFRMIDVFCQYEGARVKVGRYDFGEDITKRRDQTLKIDVDIRVGNITSP